MKKKLPATWFVAGSFFSGKRMENEKGFYVALGVYIGELQKRTDLKNDEICKSVHIGHSTFNDLKKGQNAH